MRVNTVVYISEFVTVKEFNRSKIDNCLQYLFPNVLKLNNCFSPLAPEFSSKF